MFSVKRYTQCLIIITLGCGLSVPVTAIERLSAQQLMSSCSAPIERDKINVSPCAMYVMGLFAGMEIYGNNKSSETSFQDRALKTRIGGQLPEGTVAPEPARYCISSDTTLAVFIGQLKTAEPSKIDFSTDGADKLVRYVLHQHYRCPK